MDWSHQLNIITQTPETVTDVVELLLSILNNEQKSNIAVMNEDDLIDLHFSLRLAIRNADLGSKLIADCGVVHPDDVSGVMILNL